MPFESIFTRFVSRLLRNSKFLEKLHLFVFVARDKYQQETD